MENHKISRAVLGEKPAPPVAAEAPEAPDPTSGLPAFPKAAWRGPFAEYRTPSMHVASTREGCS